ncbi:hypothetical protein L6R52_09865 [Myxococcota bacterium]|nr:hypothetical protein [Myxococcota bacterium]
MSLRHALLPLALTLATACGGAADTGLEPSDAGAEPSDAGAGLTAPDAAERTDAGGADAEGAAEDAASIDVPDAAPEPAPSYTRDVFPIFEARCQGCHFVTDNPPQIIGAAETHARLVDRPSPTVPSLDWIEPGDPDRSYLLRKIEGTHRAVGGRGGAMPPRVADPTTAEERATLRAWIAAGARDD